MRVFAVDDVLDRPIEIAQYLLGSSSCFADRRGLLLFVRLRTSGSLGEIALHAQFFERLLEGALYQLARGVLARAVGGQWPSRAFISSREIGFDSVLGQMVG